MRFNRVVRASDSQCRSRNCPGFRSQHPPTQWNLRGGRWSSVEYRTLNKSKKIPPLKFLFLTFHFLFSRSPPSRRACPGSPAPPPPSRSASRRTVRTSPGSRPPPPPATLSSTASTSPSSRPPPQPRAIQRPCRAVPASWPLCGSFAGRPPSVSCPIVVWRPRILTPPPSRPLYSGEIPYGG